MEEITPSVEMQTDFTGCDGTSITKNLLHEFSSCVAVTRSKHSKGEPLLTYLRIRSHSSQSTQCFDVMDSSTLLVVPPKRSNNCRNNSNNKSSSYNFTHIFNQNASQSEIYETCALPVVKRFMSGENGLIFTYGITSSGKSYTIRGTSANPGLIPQSLRTIFDGFSANIDHNMFYKPFRFCELQTLSEEQQQFEQNLRNFIFQTVDKTANSSCSLNSFRSQLSSIEKYSCISNSESMFGSVSDLKYSVWITFSEIYKESLYDLLGVEIDGEKSAPLKLLQDRVNQNFYINGLRQINVKTAEEAYKVFLYGQNNLHISSTDLNSKSSRSHCAFTITIIKYDSNNFKNMPIINNLSFCDLAGAERSDKANNKGDRIKEAGKINSSLLALDRCISGIRHNQRYTKNQIKVNYRDSKLTKLFQPYLSGSGMTTMIFTINPIEELFDETDFALKFTSIASKVVVNTEDQSKRLQESLRRLTQVWMQSSQRWSNFAHLHPPPKPSILYNQLSAINLPDTIIEEEEDAIIEITHEEVAKRVNDISRLNFSNVDPQELELLRSQVELLTDKLNQAENDKFDLEINIRHQVVEEFGKIMSQMEELADEKDKAKKRLEEMMGERINKLQKGHNEEIIELKEKILKYESEIFKETEECVMNSEKAENLITQNKELENKNLKLENQLQIYNNKIEELNDKNKELENEINKLKLEGDRSRVLIQDLEAKSMDEQRKLNDILKENSDLLIILKDKSTHINDLENKMSELSETLKIMSESEDKNTSVSDLIVLRNKDASVQLDYSLADKSTCIAYEVKHESTSTDTVLVNSVTTSPLCIAKSNISTLTDEEVVSVLQFKQMIANYENELKQNNEHKSDMEKMKSYYENELKQKDAVIAFNREIVEQRDQELKKLKEENQPKFVVDSAMCIYKHLKTEKANSSVCSTINSLNDDNTSLSTIADKHILKPLKQIKYSSRKKNIINSSTEKRYLSACTEEPVSERTSLTAKIIDKSQNDELEEELVFSVQKKKSINDRKRKQNLVPNENEEVINKAPLSKRKKPPNRHLTSCSPISPIPDAVKRVTRSRARKALNYNY